MGISTAHRVAIALPLALLACGDNTRTENEELGPVVDPLEWVDPTIGTGGFGFAYGSAFVGAAAPHGLVKLGPDSSGEFGTVAFQHFSGYYAGDDVIEAFSHMHLHGAGATDYGLVGVMPTLEFDAQTQSASSYRSRFEKTDELAAPGRYQVVFSPSGIAVDLTATTRGAHHRYIFPEASGSIVIDLAHTLSGGEVSDVVLDLGDDSQSFTASFHHEGQMSGGFGGYDVFVAGRTRSPWASADVWAEGAALHFGEQTVEVQLALSLVSAEGAAANLAAELPAWDFEATAAATAQAWRDKLSPIIVSGGTVATRRMFYSALYRSFMMPTIISDVSGEYVFGGEAGTADIGDMVSDLSLWDTYRTLHPLYDLIDPQAAGDAVRSLLAMADRGEGFPRWPIATGESGTMLGASADVVLADAAIKLPTMPGVDHAVALDRLVEIATDPDLPRSARGGRHPADAYIELGYVPASENRSVSTHLEFVIDDHAVARMAEALGESDIAAQFDNRAASFRSLFDPQTETFRPRLASGDFAPADDYDPLAFGDEFAEANAEQMLWSPLYDAPGLAELLGGPEAAASRLLTFFQQAQTDLDANPLDSIVANASPRIHYWHGNEPDIHAAYLFGQFGRNDLTQQMLAWILSALYSDTPSGLAGNDDGGTLSSWYVWTALGIYPIAGSDRYFVGAPLFPKITVETPTGTLTIEAPGAGDKIGVSAVRVSGETLALPEIRHRDLEGDAVIEFDMSDTPTDW